MVSISVERAKLAQVGLVLRRREQWGAKFNYTNARPVEEPATRLFLHITITNPGSYRSNDAHWRAVEAIGINRFPQTGMSYNAGILPGGVLYEGQPWGRRGAHTVNTFKRSACTSSGCPGRGAPITAPSWNLNINARACALARNLNDPVIDADVKAAAMWGAGYKLAGLATRDARWHGHRCVTAKDCPGAKAWARLDDISDLTADYVRTGLPGSTPSKEWDEMASKEEVKAALREVLTEDIYPTMWQASVKRSLVDMVRSGQLYAIEGGFAGTRPADYYNEKLRGTPTYAKRMADAHVDDEPE